MEQHGHSSRTKERGKTKVEKTSAGTQAREKDSNNRLRLGQRNCVPEMHAHKVRTGRRTGKVPLKRDTARTRVTINAPCSCSISPPTSFQSLSPIP